MVFVYNVAYFLLAVFSLPVFIFKLRQADDAGELLRQRSGILNENLRLSLKGKNVLWLHAVSVGEVMAVEDFIRKFSSRWPEYHWVLTTVTPTGQKVARRLISEKITVCYFPFDFSFSVARFFEVLRPQFLFLAETEIWPNLITQAFRRKVPIGILNARLSPRSSRRYIKFGLFFRGLFEKLSLVLAQTESDQLRFIEAGTSAERVHVAGNMKYDNVVLDRNGGALAEELRDRWFLRPEWPVGVAGSTHPGEEELIGRVFLRLRGKFPDLKWLIAPRHIERAAAIAKALGKMDLRCALTSSLEPNQTYDVLIMDQLGILKDAYSLAHVVFMGGSMVNHGGQNPIEAAAFRKAIVHGPYVFNFERVYQGLIEEGGSILADGGEQLLFVLERLLSNSVEREKLGENAHRVVASLRGSTDRHLDWIADFLQAGYQPVKG